MRNAIAFGIIVVLFAILMPDVFHAMSALLLALFTKATAVVQSMPTPGANNE